MNLEGFVPVKITNFKSDTKIFATISDHPFITFNARFCEIAESNKWRVLYNDSNNQIAIKFLSNDTKETGIATVRKIGKSSTRCYHADFIEMFQEKSNFNGKGAIRVYGIYYPEEHCVVFSMRNNNDK